MGREVIEVKLEEEFVGGKRQFAEYLRQVADAIDSGELYIRGTKIDLPDQDMEYKIKSKSEFGAHKMSIAIEWLDDQPDLHQL
jgi:amphi-Trp domain-containing protein